MVILLISLSAGVHHQVSAVPRIAHLQRHVRPAVISRTNLSFIELSDSENSTLLSFCYPVIYGDIVELQTLSLVSVMLEVAKKYGMEKNLQPCGFVAYKTTVPRAGASRSLCRRLSALPRGGGEVGRQL